MNNFRGKQCQSDCSGYIGGILPDRPCQLYSVTVVIGIAIQYRFFPGRCTVMSDVCLKKKYKLALWSLAVLPWGIFSAVMFAEKGDPWVVLTYAMILFFVVCFSYYRIKVSKAKVWRVVLEAVGLLMVEYLFMILAGLALVYYDLIPLA